MSIYIKDGLLYVPGAQDKLRQKGQERPGFFSDYTMIDIETTGLSPYRDRITELGGVKVRGSQVVKTFSSLVKFPKNNRVPAFITRLNGITEEQILEQGIPAAQAISNFRQFIGQDLIAGYNVNFDLNFIYDLGQKYALSPLNNDYIDVLRLARIYYPNERHNRLLDCLRRAGIAQTEKHHGLADSLDTIKVYQDFQEHFTPELLQKAGASLKNIDLTADNSIDTLRNPMLNKKVILAGNLHMDTDQAAKMIKNLGGIVVDQVTPATNYLIMGDHDFFSKTNPTLNQARALIKEGARIKRLSESFYLNMMADWARQ